VVDTDLIRDGPTEHGGAPRSFLSLGAVNATTESYGFRCVASPPDTLAGVARTGQTVSVSGRRTGTLRGPVPIPETTSPPTAEIRASESLGPAIGRAMDRREMLLGVFERLTKPARQVVVLAQEEARRLKHDYVGTEHLLLGLLREEDGRAARVLASLGVTYESARRQVVRTVGAGEHDSPDQMPFTTPAKKNLELALHEALSLGHDYIGTEHLLLGLVIESEGVASGILRDCNADPETVRDAVLLTLTGSDAGPPEPQVPADDPAADDHGPRATSEVAASATYASGLALARAFGSTVLEPSWWPEDVEEIRRSLARFSTAPARYEILSTRRDGTPVGVIGHVGRSPREWLDGEWSEPPELAELRGLIGRVGIPARLQGVIYDQELQMHLIGYDTEDEILSTARSLRRVNPS
jgi:hypothetical protein